MRKIYLNGPIGINELRNEYGGGRPSGYGAAHHKDAGGAIIRNAIHGLEKLGYVEKVEKKGRVISKQGMQKQILNFLKDKLFLLVGLVVAIKFECRMNSEWFFVKNVNPLLRLELILEFV